MSRADGVSGCPYSIPQIPVPPGLLAVIRISLHNRETDSGHTEHLNLLEQIDREWFQRKNGISMTQMAQWPLVPGRPGFFTALRHQTVGGGTYNNDDSIRNQGLKWNTHDEL